MRIELPEVSSSIEVERIVTGPLDNNVYLLRCITTGQSVMIDAPGGDPDLLVKLCDERNVETVLVTHGHFDHVGAIGPLRASGVRVGIGSADLEMLSVRVDFAIEDNQGFGIGDVTLRALATPGHTPGSTCFAAVKQRLVFTGDTLFPGGPGATRWPYSSFEQILDSIDSKLYRLADETVVLPGHGDPTTIGSEKPHLSQWRQRNR